MTSVHRRSVVRWVFMGLVGCVVFAPGWGTSEASSLPPSQHDVAARILAPTFDEAAPGTDRVRTAGLTSSDGERAAPPGIDDVMAVAVFLTLALCWRSWTLPSSAPPVPLEFHTAAVAARAPPHVRFS